MARSACMRILCLLLAVVPACASSPPPVETTAASTCSDLADAARKEVAAAISSNASCKTDADCVETSLGASCFDSCARVVSSSGTTAVDAARAKVNAAQCKQFVEQGCKVIIPPCAPPGAPHCVSGACTI
jgi:hypothetical protein